MKEQNVIDFYVQCNKLKDIVRTGWKVIIQTFSDEWVAIIIAASPPNKQLGSMKLSIALLIFSFLVNITIAIKTSWIEHNWNGKSDLGKIPPYLSSLITI